MVRVGFRVSVVVRVVVRVRVVSRVRVVRVRIVVRVRVGGYPSVFRKLLSKMQKKGFLSAVRHLFKQC